MASKFRWRHSVQLGLLNCPSHRINIVAVKHFGLRVPNERLFVKAQSGHYGVTFYILDAQHGMKKMNWKNDEIGQVRKTLRNKKYFSCSFTSMQWSGFNSFKGILSV